LVATFTNAPASPSVLTVKTQPSAVAAVEGSPATFSWSVSGSAAAITWYKFDTAGSMQLIPGNSTPTLRLNAVTLADDGVYMTIATDSAGNTVCSQMVTLTVLPKGE